MLRIAGGLATFLLLTALPVTSVHADEPEGSTQLEVAVAEGSGTGTFGCGQQARVRYVRAAVEVRHTEHSSRAPDEGGATVVLGGAVDGARVVAMETEDPVVPEGTDPGAVVEIGDSWFQGRFGGHLRVGYRHPLFGIEGGAGVVIAPGAAETIVYPDAEFTLGPRDRIWGFVGVGAAQLTTQLSYAQPFVGLGVRPSPWLRMEGRWGRYVAGGLGPSDRVDFTWWVPFSRRVAFRGGLAVGQFEGEQPVSHEISVGLALSH